MDIPQSFGLEPPVMPVEAPPEAAPGTGPAPAASTGRKAHPAASARSIATSRGS